MKILLQLYISPLQNGEPNEKKNIYSYVCSFLYKKKRFVFTNPLLSTGNRMYKKTLLRVEEKKITLLKNTRGVRGELLHFFSRILVTLIKKNRIGVINIIINYYKKK